MSYARLVLPASKAEDVTPSGADVALDPASRAIYVGEAGDLVVQMAASGQDATFVGVQAGTVLPIRVTRIRDAGTTAGAILALR